MTAVRFYAMLTRFISAVTGRSLIIGHAESFSAVKGRSLIVGHAESLYRI